MCTCLSPVIRDSARQLGEDFVIEVGKIYDSASLIAQNLLSIYETLSGMMGVGCYHGGRLALAGALWINTQIGNGAGICGHISYHAFSAFELAALRINDLIGIGAGVCGYGLYVTVDAIGNTFKNGAAHTARFIKNNWKQILLYLFAWGVVISCSGALYGFQAVALPLTIGFGVGIGVGGILGILTTKIFDPNDRYRGKNTAWDLLNWGIESLDQNGTRQIVLAISVTVLLAASVVFPYALGGVFGFLVGNQIVTKAGFDRDLGPDPRNRERNLRNLRQVLEDAQRQLDQLEEGHGTNGH